MRLPRSGPIAGVWMLSSGTLSQAPPLPIPYYSMVPLPLSHTQGQRAPTYLHSRQVCKGETSLSHLGIQSFIYNHTDTWIFYTLGYNPIFVALIVLALATGSSSHWHPSPLTHPLPGCSSCPNFLALRKAPDSSCALPGPALAPGVPPGSPGSSSEGPC